VGGGRFESSFDIKDYSACVGIFAKNDAARVFQQQTLHFFRFTLQRGVL
jgi:hypothetical protein